MYPLSHPVKSLYIKNNWIDYPKIIYQLIRLIKVSSKIPIIPICH